MAMAIEENVDSNNTNKSDEELNSGNNTEDNSNSSQENNSEGEKTVDELVQEKVEAIIKNRIQRETEKTHKVQETLDTTIAELNTLKQEKETLLNANKEYNSQILKLNLSISEGVSLDVINSLKGETEEDLKNAISVIKSQTNNKNNSLFSGKEFSKSEETVSSIILSKIKNKEK